jgi:2-polyprenyl-3-methyl-5-hydroxy-6-metoxy-1,4-benzoquinol methylase
MKNKFLITISRDFNDAVKKRYKSYFRFDNSPYWKKYYSPKIRKGDFKREVLYASILKRYVKKNGKIVDVGSGFGFLAKEIYKLGLNIECVDLFDEMIAEAKKYLKGTNINIHKADILNIPFEDKSVSCITLESVIEHFPIQEVNEDILPYLKSKLEDGGYLFIHTPVKTTFSVFARALRKYINKDLPEWAIDDDGDITHKIWISYTDYIKLISSHGFELVNYDFRTTRSNMKPRFLHSIMQMTQNYLKDSDEEFSVLINEENNVKYLKKKLKSHLALTSYILFRKK